MIARDSETGFSLVETLVALAVIAGMAGILFEAVAANAQAASGLARRREAVMLAQSLLAQATMPPGPGELAEKGEWNGLAWRFSRRPIAVGARDSGLPLEEVRIDVVAQPGGRRLVTVRTLRLDR